MYDPYDDYDSEDTCMYGVGDFAFGEDDSYGLRIDENLSLDAETGELRITFGYDE